MVYCQIRLAVLDIFRLSIIKLSIFIAPQRYWLVYLQGHLLGHEDNYSTTLDLVEDTEPLC